MPSRADAPEGAVNRAVEREVAALGGHKSLYSEAYYERTEFDSLYAGPARAEVSKRYDPDGRLTGLFDKAVAKW